MSMEVDVTEDLMLEILKDIQRKVSRTESRIDDLTARIGHLETGLARVGVQVAEFSVRMDSFDSHLERIEARLNIR